MDNNMYEQNQNGMEENAQYSSYYEMPVQPQQPMPMNMTPELEVPVTVGEWVISMLLLCIPCVNIVLMFVWAFSNSEKKSKSNFFKAALIWYGIAMVLSIIMSVLIAVGAFAAVGSM